MTPAVEFGERLARRTDAAYLFSSIVAYALTCDGPQHALRRAAWWVREVRPYRWTPGAPNPTGVSALPADELRWLAVSLDGACMLAGYLDTAMLRAAGRELDGSVR